MRGEVHILVNCPITTFLKEKQHSALACGQYKAFLFIFKPQYVCLKRYTFLKKFCLYQSGCNLVAKIPWNPVAFDWYLPTSFCFHCNWAEGDKICCHRFSFSSDPLFLSMLYNSEIYHIATSNCVFICIMISQVTKSI